MPDSYKNILSLTAPAPGEALPCILTGDELRGLGKYLIDESRRAGQAEAVAFPSTVDELAALLADDRWAQVPVTISGARTGIAGGAVPDGGMVVTLERMNRMLGLRKLASGEFVLRCQAGVLLNDIRQAVETGRFADIANWSHESRLALDEFRQGRWLSPPDPTEMGASLGGMIACNASGAHTFLYGPTRPYVHSLTVVLADGHALSLERGQCRANRKGQFFLNGEGGEKKLLPAPSYALPRTKNAAGFFSGSQMDAIDLFIGSEGTLGIVAEAEIRLVRAPEFSSAQVVFWRTEAEAVRFVKALRGQRQQLGLEAVEYFCPRSLAFLRNYRSRLGVSSGVPACLPDTAGCAVYLDLGTSRPERVGILRQLVELIRELGGDPGLSWSAHDRSEREVLRRFRHALPEAVNSRIAATRRDYPSVTKLGTDMAVPDECLDEILALYHGELATAGLDYVMFGHIGDNHVHVNILPRNPDEYARGKELYLNFARRVVELGGSPAAEHGIGKLKIPFLKLMLGDDGIAQMKAVKAALDPTSRLSPGNLF